MLSVPDRLLPEKFVTLIHRSPQLIVLKKQLDEPVIQRQSYVSRHALTLVRAGIQRIMGDEGEEIFVEKGEMGVLKKGLYTVSDILPRGGSFESWHFFFDDHLLEEIIRTHVQVAQGGVGRSFFKVPETPYLHHFLDGMEQLNRILHKAGTEFYRIKVLELFAALSSEYPELGKKLGGMAVRASRNLLAFMEAHYDKPLGVQDFAYLSGRSLSTFRREFKARYGTSPRKWIIQKRLEKAKNLLEKGQLSVTDVAFEVGYENLSHFISAFKKAHGYTPGRQINSM